MLNEEQDFQEEANEEIISVNEEDNESEYNDSSGKSDGEEEEVITLTKEEYEKREKEIRKEQDKRWKERLKKADKSKKEDSTQEKDNKKEISPDERYDRLELKTEGVKDKEQQDLVLDYAKLKGISVTEALNTSVVKAELKEMQEVANNREATSAPSRRTAQKKKDDVSYLLQQFEKGKVPDTPEARKKLRKALANK